MTLYFHYALYIKSKAKSSYFSQMQRPDTFLLLHASFLFTPSAKFCKTTIYDVYSRVVKTIKNITFIFSQIWRIFKKQSQLIFKTKNVLPSFSPQNSRIFRKSSNILELAFLRVVGIGSALEHDFLS